MTPRCPICKGKKPPQHIGPQDQVLYYRKRWVCSGCKGKRTLTAFTAFTARTLSGEYPPSSTIEAADFAQFLVDQTPHFDALIMKDIKPSDGWITQISTNSQSKTKNSPSKPPKR